MYITNLEDGLRNNGTKLYDEKDPNEKKPAARNRLSEEPSLNNPNHVFDFYEESVTEFRQPIQVQSHLEMSGILVLLGCIQRT